MTEVSTNAKKTTEWTPALRNAGKAIAAHIERADKSLGKYVDHMDSAGQHLLTARDTCKEEKRSFTRFLKDHGIGKTRAYQILAVADGTMTKEELLEKNAKAQREYQKKLKEKADKADKAEKAEPAPERSEDVDDTFDLKDFMAMAKDVYDRNDKAEFMKWLQNEIKDTCHCFGVPLS